jgi:fumarylacetoacetase
VHQHVRSQIQETLQQRGLDGFPSCSKEDAEAVTMHLPVEIRDFAGIDSMPATCYCELSLTSS